MIGLVGIVGNKLNKADDLRESCGQKTARHQGYADDAKRVRTLNTVLKANSMMAPSKTKLILF
jgi:hypothetical protein